MNFADATKGDGKEEEADTVYMHKALKNILKSNMNT